MRNWLGALALLLAVPAVSPAQPAPPAVAAASIADASWLSGRWVGEGLGGRIEETWAQAHGGQMVGHFVLVRDGAPVFYELMLLDEQPGGLRLRVKHFNPDFVGWEERGGWHSFEPRGVEPHSLRFDGLWLRHEGDELLITITLRERSGAVQDHVLRLRRAPL